MKISELRKGLKNVLDVHGDIEVVVQDADTQWLMEITPADLAIKNERFVIGCGYCSRYYKDHSSKEYYDD